MKMHTYGDYGGRLPPPSSLFTPMLSSASRMKAAVADHMGDGLHFLIPDLSAHGDEASAPYSSAIEEAEAIHSWLVDHQDPPSGLGIWGVARRRRIFRATALSRSVVRPPLHRRRELLLGRADLEDGAAQS